MVAPLPTDTTTTNASAHFTMGGLPKPEIKWKRILRALLNGSLNRFNAEKHGDHCLPSTIADIQREKLISIAWSWEDVPALGGSATARVKRYWVDRDPANLRRARDVLGLHDGAGGIHSGVIGCPA